MVPKAKDTGTVLEKTVIPALENNGYEVKEQLFIGETMDGRKHKVDILAKSSTGDEILISLKWQQTSGTTQEKIPFEVIKLIHAIQNSNGRFERAYIVLGGEGMTRELRDFYLQGGLKDYIKHYDLISIISLDKFITSANKQAL